MSNRKLSKHVTEEIFCYSDTAKVLKIKNEFTPTVFKNAVILCQDFLDPILDFYAKKLRGGVGNPATLLMLSSGYRCPGLNKIIHGDIKSQHQFGNAADMSIFGFPAKALFNDIISGRIKQRNGKPLKDIVDQCIYEQNTSGAKWVHIGRAGKPRKQFMKALVGAENTSCVNVFTEI